ncbi:MAG TPA: metalloregulator ArsR/SmtB family transcription factor [Candidatus Limnocylindria bacterium]|nr:metalloregulator ArsR/SmtB family transcription factor [Candidatus Limnocylindria bacterium]
MATALPAALRTKGTCCVIQDRPSERRADATAGLFRALADPTRVAIVSILRDAKDPVCICDLVATFELSQPTVSHHMARLREAGLVESIRSGIWAFYRLRRDLPAPARRVIDAIP